MRPFAEAAALLYEEEAINLQIPMEEPARGREAMQGVFTRLFRAFPDNHTDIEQMLGEGEWVILEWSLRGIFRGEFADHAATGRTFVLRGAELFQVIQDKIRLQRGYWDKTSWFKQLALPID